MLRWALFFLLVSLFAALFGFSGLTLLAVHIAQVLFYVCLGCFAVMLAVGLLVG